MGRSIDARAAMEGLRAPRPAWRVGRARQGILRLTPSTAHVPGLLLLVVLSNALLQLTDDQLIRVARERSNAAIAGHDLDGIAGVWLDDVHVVSSTSAQAAGKNANRERMAAQFKNRPDTLYVRTPATIEVYGVESRSERGEWTGKWTEPDGVLEIAGTYQAQWRKIDGRWLIQGELFVPTRCTGSKYCRQRP